MTATAVAKSVAQLATEWSAETAHLSSAAQMAAHPAYQAIIGMGQAAVPLILHELHLRPGHWFLALRSITSVNPVPTEARGNVEAMRQSWLEWGRNAGHLA